MAYNTIKLKKYSDIINEYTAAATITPGMLLELTTAGKIQAHSASGQNAVPYIALEDERQGNGIDDNYSADDKVQVWVGTRGEEAYMILADGENISIGDYLESNGAGYLKKHSAESAAVVEYPLAIVAQALEAKDLSGSSGAESSGPLAYNKRITVRII